MNTLYNRTPNFPLITAEERLYQVPFPLIGLTGGVAMGKSSVLQLFQQAGFFTISADSIVKEIYLEKTTEFFLQEHFPDCIDEHGIHYKKIRSLIFQSQDKKKELEDFLYPQIPLIFRKKTSHLHYLPPSIDYCVYEIPLLFEKKLEKKFDCIITVFTSEETQKKRLKNRDHMNDHEINYMLSHQLPINYKIQHSHFTIANDSDEQTLQENTKKMIQSLWK
jgi:dephospho-CoA kinase